LLFSHRHRSGYYPYPARAGLYENYSRKLEGIKAISSLTYTGGSVTEYMENTIRQLNSTIVAAGCDEISLTELTMAIFLNILPNRFNNIRSLLEASEDLKVNNVRKKIQEEEQRQNVRKDGTSINNFI
jgi:hypothetical protein